MASQNKTTDQECKGQLDPPMRFAGTSGTSWRNHIDSGRAIDETGGAGGWRLALYENRTLVSAITAAVTGTLVGYPFDSLKTRMQTRHYSSLLACAQRSISEEGIKGLYRGCLPPLLTSSAAKSLSFSVFEATKHWLIENDPLKNPQIPPSPSPSYLASASNWIPNFQRETLASVAFSAFISGSAAGAIISLVSCPLELVKVQMQLAALLTNSSNSSNNNINCNRRVASVAVVDAVRNQQGGSTTTPATTTPASKFSIVNKSTSAASATYPKWARSNLSVLKEIVRQRGIPGLYYGVKLHTARDVCGTAIYFSSYETVKETLRRINGTQNTGALTHMMAGGICGVISWLVIFPIDLLKSTIQSQVLDTGRSRKTYTSSLQCARDIYGRLGLSGLYRGVSVSLIRAFPIHGLNFVVYEWTRANICRLAGQKE